MRRLTGCISGGRTIRNLYDVMPDHFFPFPGEGRGPVGRQKEMGDAGRYERPPTGPRPSPGSRKGSVAMAAKSYRLNRPASSTCVDQRNCPTG
jgi:hypothetical protein